MTVARPSALVRPFTVSISDSEIGDLKQRLARTRWPDPETVGDWSQGVQVENARALLGYWERGYDWRRLESGLNRFPQFLTEIDGLDIRHPRQVQEPRRDAADPHARMAGLDRRVPEADSPTARRRPPASTGRTSRPPSPGRS
jgi:Epoxide hydrolase N terminus